MGFELEKEQVDAELRQIGMALQACLALSRVLHVLGVRKSNVGHAKRWLEYVRYMRR